MTSDTHTVARRAETRSRRASLASWSAAPVLPAPLECLALARAGIGQVQQLLLLPTAESLVGVEVCMRNVADRLKQFKRAMAAATPAGAVDRNAVNRAIHAVRKEFEQAEALLQRAAQFHGGWTQMLSARQCGYTRDGSPAKLLCARESGIRA
jgi:hypothetical protein